MGPAMRLGRAALGVIAVALFAAPQPGVAATPVSAASWKVDTGRLGDRLARACFVANGTGWTTSSDGVNWMSRAPTAVTGALDLSARTGALAGHAPAMLIDSSSQRTFRTGHAWAIDDWGLELRAGRARVTARVHSARSRMSAGRRTTIAVIDRPRISSGVRGGIPNTFAIVLRGRAKLAAGFVDAARRWRCRGRAANFRASPFRVGQPLGNVTVTLGAAAATGLGGTIELVGGGSFRDDENQPVTVTPTGAAMPSGTQDERSLRFAIPAGARVLLACVAGSGCDPRGDAVVLGGGFVVAARGRSLTVADLVVAWTVSDGRPVLTLRGAIDGQPLTIATGEGRDTASSAEFHAAVEAALGARLTYDLRAVDARFTSTGPP